LLARLGLPLARGSRHAQRDNTPLCSNF